jgi:phosphoserine phosphatase RsbU/P
MAPTGLSRRDLRKFFQQQQLYVFVAVAVFALFTALRLTTRLWSVLVFSLCVGNLAVPVMSRFERYYTRRAFPFNWLIFIPLLGLVSMGSVAVATAVLYWLVLPRSARTDENISSDFLVGTLITTIIGIVIRIYYDMRTKLEKQNVALQQAVQTGTARLEQQEKELETAREIQAGLIPKQIPQFGNLRIVASWQPARAVGGDYFDVIQLNETRVAICIADVAGKGIAAALLMANVQAAVKAFATADAPPSEVCERLNRVLCSNLAAGKFVTLLYCVVDTVARTLTYSNAGHCFPLLARSTGEIVICTDGGVVLGVIPESKYSDWVVHLKAGDKLLLFTDGIPEAMNRSAEEFGESRLKQVLTDHLDGDIEAIHSRLMQDVSRFCEGNFADDATLVLLSYAGIQNDAAKAS